MGVPADGRPGDLPREVGDSSGQIHGVRWEDINGDGERDTGEPGLVGRTIFLDGNYNGQLDPGERSTITLADDPGTPQHEAGTYAFTGLTPGVYTVAEVLPPGWVQTLPYLGGAIQRVSLTHDGGQANQHSLNPSISADGRWVAFESYASDLVPDDTNGKRDIFVYDRQTGSVERVSVNPDGTERTDHSGSASISADGRYVAFASGQIYVHDRQTGQIEQASVASDGAQANSNGVSPSISADGRYVSFHSTASNLVNGDTNAATDVFVRDRQAGTTERVSVSADGVQGNSGSFGASLSANGRWVAFSSYAWNLVPNDTNGEEDTFVYDRQTSTIERASVASDGTQGNNDSQNASISADGRYVAFESTASDLVSGDTNAATDVFVHDLQAATTERVSVASDGTQATRGGSEPSISGDGRYVTFHSVADDLVDGDTNGEYDVFVHDGQTGFTRCVSVSADGGVANEDSQKGSISADGRWVAFDSEAYNLVPGDTNYMIDVLVSPTAAAASPDTHTLLLMEGQLVEGVNFGNLPIMDFGDAPDPTYPTLLASGGARHRIVPGWFLGTSVDDEFDGQPDSTATGDDTSGNNDDNGVVFGGPLVKGMGVSITVTASQAGKLDAWIDLNRDGRWDATEQVADSRSLTAGTNDVGFTVPETAAVGDTFARFRFSSAGNLDPDGPADDGEVEDYMVAIEPATDLGEVDHVRLPGLDLSVASRWHKLRTARAGYLTVEADYDPAGGTVSLSLYGQSGLLVGGSSIGGGYERIDHQPGGPGEVYFVRLSGSNPQVDLGLTNLLARDGTTVTVYGTGGDDRFEFAPQASYRVTVNGVQYHFEDTEVDLITFDGGGGNDTAELTGSAAAEIADLRPSSASLTGAGFQVNVTGTSEVTVHGGGGADVASLYDSPGDDTFRGAPNRGEFSAGGYTSTAVGFPAIHAYANDDGHDVARLDDSDGDDELTAKPTFARLTGEGFFLRVKLFEEVYVTGSGGHDAAVMSSYSGINTFVGGPNHGTFSGAGFSNSVESFDGVHAYARGGYNTATLYDSPGDDTVVAMPKIVRTAGEGYVTRVKFFAEVEVVCTAGGKDVAHMYDSDGDDTFTARPEASELSGPRFHNKVTQINEVYGYAQEGGHDVAHLYDTTGDDTFYVVPGDGKLYGPGYYSRAIGFDAAHGYATSTGRDVAQLYDSSGDDTFIGWPTWGKLTGPGYLSRVKFFEAVHAYGSSGGSDTANLYDSADDDTFIGQPTVSKLLLGNGNLLRAKFFEEVYAQCTEGGDDSADLYDSSGDDLLEAAGDWAQLSSNNAELDFLYRAVAFQSVTATSTTGNDTKTIAPEVDFLELLGNWEDP